MLNQESILEEAKRIVHGDRGENYGHPFEDFSRTAKIWSAILGINIEPEQVALCMVGVKISREVNRPKRDNIVDGAGYFETLDMVVNTGALVQFRFNKRQDRLYIDIDKSRMAPGNYLLIECHRALDPEDWSQVYNDSFLKRYATALMKKQWGQNLIKYNNVTLPGGLTLNGRQIWEDAVTEIQQLEDDMPTKYTLPPIDMIG